MSKTIKVALAGAGAFGIKHLDGIKNIDGVEVVSLISRDLEKTREVADQYGIARTQVEREAAAAAQARHFLFCDTTPLMTVVYSRHYFDGADARLAALADATHYDVTLVTAPDSPWVADGLQRESEAVRQLIYRLLLEELDARGIVYHVLHDSLEARLAQAAPLLRQALDATPAFYSEHLTKT